MALFCKECLRKVMGLDPKKHPEWLIDFEGDCCEGCVYKYLKQNKQKQNGSKRM